MKKLISTIIKIGLFIDAVVASITVFLAFRKKQIHNKRDLVQDIFILFGGKQERYPDNELQSPMYSVYFGGLDLDLTDAQVKGDYLNIDVEVMFGGVNLVVPDHWNITINNLGTIFGGISKDFESDMEQSIVDVMINAKVTFGGLNIMRSNSEVADDTDSVELDDDEVETLETWEANEQYDDLDESEEMSDLDELVELDELDELVELDDLDDLVELEDLDKIGLDQEEIASNVEVSTDEELEYLQGLPVVDELEDDEDELDEAEADNDNDEDDLKYSKF